MRKVSMRALRTVSEQGEQSKWAKHLSLFPFFFAPGRMRACEDQHPHLQNGMRPKQLGDDGVQVGKPDTREEAPQPCLSSILFIIRTLKRKASWFRVCTSLAS